MFTESTALPSSKDLFDVRLKILRHTNPLRAKILIFSILYHPFKFSTRDWLTIKMQDLDNLIRHLYSICPIPTELEERLHETTRKLNRQEEDFTTASVIFKAMKPLYGNPEIDRAAEVISSNKDEQLESDDSNPDLDDDDDDDETQWLDLDSGNLAFNGKPIGSLPPSNSANQSDRNPEEDDDLTQPLFLYDLDRLSDSISYDSGDLNSPKAEEHLLNSPELDRSGDRNSISLNPASDYQKPYSNSPILAIDADNNRGNISASFLRKMDLEDDVQRLIDEQAQKVRQSLMEAVRHAEEELDRISIDRSGNDRISIKYQALQQLTDKLFAHLTQIQDILRVQAKTSPPLPQSVTSLNSQRTTLPATPETIVALLNPILKPQGIKTLAKQKEGCLHIVLESYGAATLQESQTLNPQKLITFVRTALLDLNLETIDRIKVYGRKPGHQSPEWIQTIFASQQ